MTKEKQYKEISKLFPSTLAAGDVVEDAQFGQWEALFINTMHQGIPLWCFQNIGNQETALWGTSYVKIIRKNITLSMVLAKMNRGLSGDYEFYEIEQTSENRPDLMTITVIGKKKKSEDWILGKPLYDQSIELIKLVWEVLR